MTRQTLTRMFFVLAALACKAQDSETRDTTPVAVQWTIDAASPIQRTAIKSVFLLVCTKSRMKGTGFLLTNSLIVTNNHVVEGCTAAEMIANPFGGQQFGFDNMATDKDVDLALLRPSKHLGGGLELGVDQDHLFVQRWRRGASHSPITALLRCLVLDTSRDTSETGRTVKK